MLLYQDALVQERKWLTEEEFFELLTVAQLLPGPNLINLSAYISNRLFGSFWISVLGVVALALPGALMGVGLVAVLNTKDEQVARIFQGFSFGSIVFLLVLLARLGRNVQKDSRGSYRIWARPLLAFIVALASFVGAPLLPLLGLGIVLALLLEFAWR